MPKVSVNILTKDRAELLRKALLSVGKQSFKDFEVVVVVNGSKDNTLEILQAFKHLNIQPIIHAESIGITAGRQQALERSRGEYIAILDDDDEWINKDKLALQSKFLDEHPETVMLGGGIRISNSILQTAKFRPETDAQIRSSLLFKNNFFTSTVMFRKTLALQAGGFIKDEIDLAEDYDLWLRMGRTGQMYNFQQAFTNYRQPGYNKAKFKQFLRKQLALIGKHKKDYPFYFFANIILRLRLLFGI